MDLKITSFSYFNRDLLKSSIELVSLFTNTLENVKHTWDTSIVVSIRLKKLLSKHTTSEVTSNWFPKEAHGKKITPKSLILTDRELFGK